MALEAVLDRPTHSQIIVRIRERFPLAARSAISRAIKQLEPEIHFREHAKPTQARDTDFRPSLCLRRGLIAQASLSVVRCCLCRSGSGLSGNWGSAFLLLERKRAVAGNKCRDQRQRYYDPVAHRKPHNVKKCLGGKMLPQPHRDKDVLPAVKRQ